MRSILVICTRRIGDVLLATPLIRSLRLAYPQAAIDVLLNRASAVALEGNPDVCRRMVLSEPPQRGESWTVLRETLRRYELGVCTLASDRPHLMAFLAASRRVGVVPPPGEPGAAWKRWLCQASTELDLQASHTVVQYLRLADCLGIARHPNVVPPRPAEESAIESLLGKDWARGGYAVLHPAPMFRYKAWTLEGWQGLIRWLTQGGLRVIVTGGPAPAEREYVARVTADLGLPAGAVTSVAGHLPFAALTPLIERAALFVGPDTSVTHLAAATGCPTVALFGPSSPVAWGPWPQGYDGDQGSPWVLTAPLQHRGNVWIVQGITHCVPCLLEGCERRIDSRADCLDLLPLQRVVPVVEQALRRSPVKSRGP
ncbi:MAG TPA: glycosyltransferase family 9 protein [Solimonas sp.]|nr:glycosyltransferase family 9 protein [Solimonas sp.]